MTNLNFVMPMEVIDLNNIVKRAEMYMIFVKINAIKETIEEFYMKMKKDY